jgi:hypothetical protein
VAASSIAVLPAPPEPQLDASIFAEGWEVSVARTHGSVLVYDRTLGAMVTVDGEVVRRVVAPFQYVPSGPGVAGDITGGWPEGALLTTRTVKPSLIVRFLRRTHGAWELQHLGSPYQELGVITYPFDTDAAGVNAILAPADHGRSVVMVTPGPPEEPILSLGGDGRREEIGTTQVSNFSALAAAPNGDIAVFGVRDVARGGGARNVVEMWRRGRPSETVALPEGTHGGVAPCVAADGVVYLARHEHASGGLLLLTLHGSSWDTQVLSDRQPPSLSGEATPPGFGNFPNLSCAVGRDGTVWISRDTEIYRRSPAATVERFAFPPLPPAPSRPRIAFESGSRDRIEIVKDAVAPVQQAPGVFRSTNVFVADDGSVWIAGLRAGGEEGENELGIARRVVLRVGPPLPGTPIDWDSFGVVEDRVAAYNAQGGLGRESNLRDVPATRSCGEHEIYLRIRTLSPAAPPDEGVPALRAAVEGRTDLAGTRFVEARRHDAHVLAALIPDYATGARLLALIKRRFPRADSALLCGSSRPPVVRVLPIHLATDTPSPNATPGTKDGR